MKNLITVIMTYYKMLCKDFTLRMIYIFNIHIHTTILNVFKLFILTRVLFIYLNKKKDIEGTE